MSDTHEGYGFSSNRWLLERLVEQVDRAYLDYGCKALIHYIAHAETFDRVKALDVFAQMISTGTYEPHPAQPGAGTVEGQSIPQSEVDKFLRDLYSGDADDTSEGVSA